MTARHVPLLAMVLALGACGTGVRQPEWVQWVDDPPPPERAELYGPPPNPGEAWVPGRWTWTATGWSWQKGTYAVPPRPEAIWVTGLWVHRNDQWAWVEGSWRLLPEVAP